MVMKENKINLIKSKDKNTYPKNIILYFANIYNFANTSIKICTKINIVFLILSVFTKTFFNVFYGFSFCSFLIILLMNLEINKSLNNDNYKELTFNDNYKHNSIMNLSSFFLINYMLFLQLTIVELIIGKGLYRFLLLIPFIYLYLMLEKGFLYKSNFYIIKDLSIIRNNFIIYSFLIAVISFILKIFLKVENYFNEIAVLNILIIGMIFCFIYTTIVFNKIFKISKKEDKKYVYPIYNYLSENKIQSFKKLKFKNVNINKDDFTNIYLEKAGEEIKKQKEIEEKKAKYLKDSIEYEQKEKIRQEQLKARESIYGLKPYETPILEVPEKKITKNNSYNKDIEDDESLDRLKQRKNR